MTITHTLKVVPMGKPRMTQRNVWAKRPCVLRYHAFRDRVRQQMEGVNVIGYHRVSFVAYLPMPKSWSQKKKDAMRGQPHQQKPDIDNVGKALLDALYQDDSKIWSVTWAKRWEDEDGPRFDVTWEKERERTSE